MKLSRDTLNKYKKELVNILKKDSNTILGAIKMLAPKDTGLMASGLKIEIGETSSGFYIKVIGTEGNKPRIKNGVASKPREYFFPSDSQEYVGPKSLDDSKLSNKLKPFIEQPIEEGIERALDTLMAKYGVRLEIGWDA